MQAAALDQRPAQLLALVEGRRVAVLTGAGISTASGIPDYRGPGTRARARNPIRFQEYAASAQGRARYWARAMLGWPRLRSAAPNPAHLALAALERAGAVVGVVTQNVDRLHQRAGSSDVIELHGALHDVRCLECGGIEPREAVQHRLVAANPGIVDLEVAFNPDGDAELGDEALVGFTVPSCERCGGVLKPDVVFFGESVPAATVARAYDRIDGADALLVVGSSLVVFSGYRFVRRAFDRGQPVAIVNLGPTRGDPYAQVVVDADATTVLPAWAAAIAATDD